VIPCVSQYKSEQSHDQSQINIFAEMTELGGTVSFEDVSKVEVKGKGSVKFLRKNGKLGIIEEVYYI
jgi:glutathione peroxidase-family protein